MVQTPGWGCNQGAGILMVLALSIVCTHSTLLKTPCLCLPSSVPLSLSFPSLFSSSSACLKGRRNTTHSRVLAGQSGGVTSFMKHGIPCCWLVVKLGTPQDRRLDRSDERQKRDCERTKGEGEMSTLTPSFPTPH